MVFHRNICTYLEAVMRGFLILLPGGQIANFIRAYLKYVREFKGTVQRQVTGVESGINR